MSAFERVSVGLFLWCSAQTTLAQDARAFVSCHGLAETVARIGSAARLRGLRVQHDDHAAVARAAGLRLPPTHALRLGTGDSALILVVWQAPDGRTMVGAREEAALAFAAAALGAAPLQAANFRSTSTAWPWPSSRAAGITPAG
ncbi:MAG: hypothetical protein RMK97_00715 [Sutterellaceae bacterium]|nr:hypothetical protein [Burkholderiaceae bacterium]MCX7901704.1 hypothetical protein [Burkholderiaceae bacterium]MDW8429021.1 hypothetical protein [Sutterellaceae bacterium]